MRSTIDAGSQRSRQTNSFCSQYVFFTCSKSRLARARSTSAAATVVVDSLTGPVRGSRTPRFYTTLCYTYDRAAANAPLPAQEATVGSVRVAIIGVGNCASSLVQGVHYYREAPDDGFIPGLMHPRLGGYHVGDIEFSAAFDIDERKVGKDLSEAIVAAPNNTVKFATVPPLGVPVQRGMTHDGLGTYLRQLIKKAPGSTADIAGILRETNTHVVVNFLPVGSEMATKWYVEQILDAGCAFVNCIPVFIAREAYWRRRFEERGLPVVGDDVKSQVGATIVHRVLTRLFMDRGVRLERTSQLNFGGNTDFFNMLERERLVSKKISKTDSVRSQLAHELPADAVHIGPSDYVPWLEDWDSPNSAGVVIDAIRCCKIALDRGLKGGLLAPAAYLMKSPPEQWPDDLAHHRLERFIAGEE